MKNQLAARLGRSLARGRLSLALRTLLSAYLLVRLAGAAPAVAGVPLPGTGVAALTLLAVLSLRAGYTYRHRWTPGRLRRLAGDHWAELSVAALTLVGLALRIRGIDFGHPAVVHPDEHVVVWPVIDMLRRGWIDPPVPYHYPTVFKYLLLPALALTYVRGRAAGDWLSLDDVGRFEFPFYLVARYHSALLGALTIPLVYILARRVDPGPRGKAAGVIGAALLAFSFIHVRESHFAVTDAAMTFFVTLALILIVGTMRDSRWRASALAGFFAGLACAVKYNALPVVLLIPVAHLLARRPGEWLDARPLLALAMVPVGFFAGYPYALLRYRPFLEHVGWLRRFQEFDAGERLRLIFGYALESGFGTIATLVLLVACVWCLYRASAQPVALVVYLAVSLYMLTHTGHRFFPRYLLPLLPAAVVIVGAFVAAMTARIANLTPGRASLLRPVLPIVTTAVLLASPAVESVEWTGAQRLRDTRGLAQEHVVEAFPPGTVAASDVQYFQLPKPYAVRDLSPIGPDAPATLRRRDVEVVVTSAEQEAEITADSAGRRAWRRVQRRLELIAELDPDELDARGPRLRIYGVRQLEGLQEDSEDESLPDVDEDR